MATLMVGNGMIAWRPLRTALMAIALVVGPLHAGNGQTYEGKELVRANLLADTTAIVPGKPFTAGLRLYMAPNWHTYWKFPGDAGIPTRNKMESAAGLEGRGNSMADSAQAGRARRHPNLRLPR